MTDIRAKPGFLRRFFSTHRWIAYGAAYLVGVTYTILGASNLYTALMHGYIHARHADTTFDSDPVDFVIKVAISCVTTLVLGTVVGFATVGWLHVWRQKHRSRRQ